MGSQGYSPGMSEFHGPQGPSIWSNPFPVPHCTDGETEARRTGTGPSVLL